MFMLRHAALILISSAAFAASNFVYYAPGTPLTSIPVYSLDASSPKAAIAIEAEIERLYTHAKTLDSGHARRALETRIYLLDKRVRPLLQTFHAPAWESLRLAVKAEWETVQAGLAPTSSVKQS